VTIDVVKGELPARVLLYPSLHDDTLDLHPVVEMMRDGASADVALQLMLTDESWQMPLPPELERRGWVDIQWDRNEIYGQATFAVLQSVWPTTRPRLLRGMREPWFSAPVRIDRARMHTRPIVVRLLTALGLAETACAYVNDRWLVFERSNWEYVPRTRRLLGPTGIERPLEIGESTDG
jgi:hypothetical protein